MTQLIPTLNRGPRGRTRSKWPVHVGLLLVCGGFVVPFAWMASTSLKSQQETLAFPPTLLPDPPRPANYAAVLTDPRFSFLLFARNTLVVTSLTVLGTTASSAVVAYGFARVRFRGRGFLFAVMLGTMMIPFPVTMVPGFVLFRWLGDHTPVQFIGTFKPLWLPAWFGSAFNIFLLRQFFAGVPEQLSEAARLDGCSEFGIFWRILLPLAKPALAVVALFSFIASWNDFLGPLIYLQRREQYTLALGLQAFASQSSGSDFHLLMAASVMLLSPVVLLFFAANKTFVQGVASTGIKG